MTKNKNTMKKKNKLYAIIATFVAIIVIIVVLCFAFIKKEETPGGSLKAEPVNENFKFLLDEPTTLIKNDDIYSGQATITSEYKQKYKKGKYTLDNPYVIINPYYISPQTALVMFETDKKEKVKVTIKGKHNDDLVVNFEASKDHFIPLYGLYGNYTNKVIIETSSGKRKELDVKIERELITGKVEVLENNVKNANGEFYFATSSFGVASMAYDNYGEVRWWLDMGYTKGITMLQNGHLLISDANEGPDITSTNGVVELDMLGYLYKGFEIDGGYHHDAYELNSGNLIILTSDINSDSMADYIVELDRNTGKIVKDWRFKETALGIDPNLIDEGEVSWAWFNSVTYDEKNKALILSVRNRNSVLSLDYETGKLNWILGEEKYWSKKFAPYLIKGVGENFIYPAGQHSVNITEDGKLSIFNNGYNSYKEDSVTCKSLKDNASYAMIYSIDSSKKEAKVEWKYGGKEYFSYALSSFTYAKNGHKVFNSGWHFAEGTDYESNSCTQFTNDKYDTYLIDFDKENNIAVKLHIEESKFEIVKAPIYNLGAVSVDPKDKDTIENYNVSEGLYLSTKEADEYTELSETEALKYKENEANFISFHLYSNRLQLVGVAPDEMQLNVILISPRGKAYKYVMKESNKEIKDYINISKLPKGRYYVYVELGDEVFNSTEYIEMK